MKKYDVCVHKTYPLLTVGLIIEMDRRILFSFYVALQQQMTKNTIAAKFENCCNFGLKYLAKNVNLISVRNYYFFQSMEVF